MSNILSFVKDLIAKYDSLVSRLEDFTLDRDEIIKIAKEKSELDEIYQICSSYLNKLNNFNDNKEIITEEKDEELRQLARDENALIEKEIELHDKQINDYLLPKDKNDSKNAIVEIRAGTGGEEAGLFAFDLFQMYLRYAELKKWSISVDDMNETENGGIKNACLVITGKSVYSRMKFEAGTHRVQRVPKTENSGRVHTSAATVVVMPELEDLDIKIDEKDIRTDVYRASGAGGQHVNKTESAVRLTHEPSGIVVTCQDGRDQRSNKDKAMKVLKSKIYAMEEEKRQQEVEGSRKDQLGSGDRSEKIRTYNFPQNRLTDHRIGWSSQNLSNIMSSGDLDNLIEALILDNQQKISEKEKQKIG
jgi:peptide chain release factor 1